MFPLFLTSPFQPRPRANATRPRPQVVTSWSGNPIPRTTPRPAATPRVSAASTPKPSCSPVRCNLIAYTGVILPGEALGQWPAVLDLSTLRTRPQVPLRLRHKDGEAGIIGSIYPFVEAGQRLRASGSLHGQNDASALVIEAARLGKVWQCSFATAPAPVMPFPAGAVVTVNGRQMRGPFRLVIDAELIEISITDRPADPNTQALFEFSGGTR